MGTVCGDRAFLPSHPGAFRREKEEAIQAGAETSQRNQRLLLLVPWNKIVADPERCLQPHFKPNIVLYAISSLNCVRLDRRSFGEHLFKKKKKSNIRSGFLFLFLFFFFFLLLRSINTKSNYS